MFSIGRMAAAVAHDPGSLLALDVAVDARHPGADFIPQLALAESQDVIGPFVDGGRWGLDAPCDSVQMLHFALSAVATTVQRAPNKLHYLRPINSRRRRL